MRLKLMGLADIRYKVSAFLSNNTTLKGEKQMNKEAMKQLIQEALTKKLGGSFHVITQKVLKTNVKLDGLVILQEGQTITPTIYLEPFYKDLENGTPLDDVVNLILRIYSETNIHPEHFDLTQISDLGYVKDRLYVQLINRHSNEELLQNVPHALFLDDFAIVIRCTIEMLAEGSASFLVHKGHLDMWQTDRETLLSHALQNTREMFGVELESMRDFLQKSCPELAVADCPDNSIWIMTNNRKLTGAAAVLFDDVLKSFAKEHGSFYVIFSSVHEVLLLPTPDDSDIDVITRMNQEVNETQVDADEVLGTKAYFYHKDRGFVL